MAAGLAWGRTAAVGGAFSNTTGGLSDGATTANSIAMTWGSRTSGLVCLSFLSGATANFGAGHTSSVNQLSKDKNARLLAAGGDVGLPGPPELPGIDRSVLSNCGAVAATYTQTLDAVQRPARERAVSISWDVSLR